MGGSKRAVLVGCNYPGTDSELHGCVNDVKRMRSCLVETYGFAEEDITVLVDTDELFMQPTGKNIRRALTRLVESAETGDCLFFHFSGHGSRFRVEPGKEDETGYDECLMPCDHNPIFDDDIRELVDKVPEGCWFTIVSDSCHSGGLIDHAKEQIGESTRGAEETEEEDRNSGDEDEDYGGCVEEEDDESRAEDYSSGVDEEEDYDNGGRDPRIRNRSLSPSSLIKNLKQRTGWDIDMDGIRHSLFKYFGEDASSKVKKLMSSDSSKLLVGSGGEGGGSCEAGLGGTVGNLAEQLQNQKLDGGVDKDEAYAMQLPDKGILISACQTNQTSLDIHGDAHEGAYGAMTRTILTILSEEGSISNRELVLRARDMLEKQGHRQRPGLYCSDQYVDAPFIC